MLEYVLRKLQRRSAEPLSVLEGSPVRPCFGRDELCDHVMRSARDQGCVLLFGGRQSGKSTALKHIAHQQIPNDPSGQLYHLPVYVDLMRLPYDAGPWDFFSMLYQCALDACKLNVASYRPPQAQHAVQSLDGFEQAAQRLRSGANQIDVRFVFLLDESKRVIGDRFPRGFHDNIFHH